MHPLTIRPIACTTFVAMMRRAVSATVGLGRFFHVLLDRVLAVHRHHEPVWLPPAAASGGIVLESFAAAALALVVATACAQARATSVPIPVVAAENFYGDIAGQIGGPYVKVTSILANPDQDPHLFEASPSVARAVSTARFVIYNGIDYDPWMRKLLDAARSTHRQSIVVADLVGKKNGDNPHIWYRPATMLALARTLSAALAADDPSHKAELTQLLARFEDSLKAIDVEIAEVRQRHAGLSVTATEPIFGYMFDALGMTVRDQSFQLAVMNNTEPSPSDIAGFESDLKTHRVGLLVYNSQATDAIADHMRALAEASHVPVVGATETEPAGESYQQWMLRELQAVDRALAGESH